MLFIVRRTVNECRADSPEGTGQSHFLGIVLQRIKLYGYARVSVREPEDKYPNLQVERLVCAANHG